MDETSSPAATQIDSGAKQGHKIFGFCCDSKRAVQIFNVISIIAKLLVLIFVLTERLPLAIYCTGIFVNIMILCGASLYNAWIIIFGVVWILAEFVFSMFYYEMTFEEDHYYEYAYYRSNQYPLCTMFGFLIWTGLMLYPHLVFITEIRSEIMTRETYARERFCCCCV